MKESAIPESPTRTPFEYAFPHPPEPDEAVRAYMRAIGKLGGNATRRKFGREHYVRAGKLSVKSRRAGTV